MDAQPTLPAEVRASLPPAVEAYVAFLESQIALLRDQVADLQARVHQNSGNSSRPPSSDPPGARPSPKRKPSGRKRGGQKGHPGHHRIKLGAHQLTARVEHRPMQCPGCTLPLDASLPAEGEPACLQTWEIPPIVPEVVEHRGYRVRCPHCAALVPAPDLPEGAFGPRLTAMASLLHGRFRLSMRETTEVFADLLGVPVGPGSIPALCQEVAAALDEPYKDGEGDRTTLQQEMAPLRAQMQSLLERGATLPSWMARGFCNDVRKLEPALWTFVTAEGVEPTNNAAERALRPAVLWRKGCFGADSAAGNSFVARVLTVAATCRQQRRNLLAYLTDAVVAYRRGVDAPSLLPVS